MGIFLFRRNKRYLENCKILIKAEFETFKRKIKLRANDLAGQLVNEYLHEERGSPEWNDISRIAIPQADPNAIDKILLSPLGTRVLIVFLSFKKK